jgi:hypothetical protein
MVGELVIAQLRKSGVLCDVWVSDAPKTDLSYLAPDEVIEFRLWDGTQIHPHTV